MRTRYNPQANDIIENFDRFVKDREELQGILNTDKKICIEIGMGKGDFISNMAKLNSDNVYIGIELSPQVLALAIKKLNRFEEENGLSLKNLYFMSFDALKLLDYFSENQVDVLYLNFSDPWPKKRHTKRRLTYKDFLENYKKVLKKDGIIEFKTDNRGLFEYSLVSMQNFGMEFIDVYLDLHKTEVFNVETEYEKKFSPFGPIYKLVAKF
jgi:tRNA (guanine-N(7)-)-methyltransferase